MWRSSAMQGNRESREQGSRGGGNNDYKIDYYNGKYDKENGILSFDELMETDELKNQSNEDIDKKLNAKKIKYKEGFLANGKKYMKVILDQD